MNSHCPYLQPFWSIVIFDHNQAMLHLNGAGVEQFRFRVIICYLKKDFVTFLQTINCSPYTA